MAEPAVKEIPLNSVQVEALVQTVSDLEES